MIRVLLIVVAVLLAQYGYKAPSLLRGDPPLTCITLINGAVVKERSWLYFILQPVCIAAFAWLLLPIYKHSRLATGALVFVIWESFETFICGAASIGHNFLVPFGDGLCTARFGPWFTPLLAALTMLVIGTRRAR